MVVDERIRLQFPRILSFVVIGAVIGAGYGYETSIADAAGLRGLIRGALAGVLISGAVRSLDTLSCKRPVRGLPAHRYDDRRGALADLSPHFPGGHRHRRPARAQSSAGPAREHFVG
jgi:hypothetical protein